ncbi:TIR domain-containing protein [Filimonas lacunae]|uniref:TIR domain-containing protein n=1 Tax=Filimonas lacunae TaxID=477680 RepID=A0A1N7RGH1_9BACT|nr:toll/interleukin-1 receptor domain-containing protein [Filimonas lacunae]SIT34246.1 TIR domain-containing protein [Filimonas lacunae]
MIVTESQFKSETKSNERTAVLLEKIHHLLEGNNKMIFISHKHEEEDYVFRLKNLLERNGFIGYVDWEDDQMPATTCGETATKLKSKIIKSYKFILIATEAAIQSKWCNWELGFGDAHKYIDHIAVFPIKKDYTGYKGEEYIQIYPTLQRMENANNINNKYYIHYPDGKEISLEKWLTL